MVASFGDIGDLHLSHISDWSWRCSRSHLIGAGGATGLATALNQQGEPADEKQAWAAAVLVLVLISRVRIWLFSLCLSDLQIPPAEKPNSRVIPRRKLWEKYMGSSKKYGKCIFWKKLWMDFKHFCTKKNLSFNYMFDVSFYFCLKLAQGIQFGN